MMHGKKKIKYRLFLIVLEAWWWPLQAETCSFIIRIHLSKQAVLIDYTFLPRILFAQAMSNSETYRKCCEKSCSICAMVMNYEYVIPENGEVDNENNEASDQHQFPLAEVVSIPKMFNWPVACLWYYSHCCSEWCHLMWSRRARWPNYHVDHSYWGSPKRPL